MTPTYYDIGRLQPGYAADFVVLDWDSVTGACLDPTAERLDTVVRRARPAAVRQVYVNGELVLAEGTLTKVDGRAMRTELRRFLTDRYGPQQQGRQRAVETLKATAADFYAKPP